MKILLILALLFPAGKTMAADPPVEAAPTVESRLRVLFPDHLGEEEYEARDAAGEELYVPYVPTPLNVVEAILELGRVGPGDVIYDLGCGDGRIVIAAASRHGIEGVGVDLDPRRIEESRRNAAAAGVEDLVSFREEDIFQTDFRRASVVAIYLMPSVNLELRPRLLEQLRPGSRLISHEWHMGDWEPEGKISVPGFPGEDGVPEPAVLRLWLIPAPAEGEWAGKIETGGEGLPLKLSLAREYQRVWGTLEVGGVTELLAPSRLAGTGLVLETGDFSLEGEKTRLRFLGNLEGDRVSGLVLVAGGRWSGVHPWQAARSTGEETPKVIENTRINK